MPSRGPLGAPRLFGVGPFTKTQDSDPPDRQDYFSRRHSYRGFTPMELRRSLNSDASDVDADDALDVMEFIEGGRYVPYLKAVQELLAGWVSGSPNIFAARNPDATLWAGLYADTTEKEFPEDTLEVARDSVASDYSRATDPPEYNRRRIRNAENLVTSLQDRPAVYNAVTPQEIHEGYKLIREGQIDGIEPREAGSVMRDIYRDIESGRLYDAADEALKMYARLDPDEGDMFARRNPGLVMWMSAFGIMNAMLHEDQLFPSGMAEESFPTLKESGGGA